MLAFVKVIESDLAAISQESRRAVPAVKEAAEHALLELRRAQAGGPRDRLGWRTLVSQCLQPVYLACNHIDAPRALLVVAMSALQRAVVADALLSGEYLNVVRVLEIQAGSADDSMRLRVLQALPLVLAQVRKAGQLWHVLSVHGVCPCSLTLCSARAASKRRHAPSHWASASASSLTAPLAFVQRQLLPCTSARRSYLTVLQGVGVAVENLEQMRSPRLLRQAWRWPLVRPSSAIWCAAQGVSRASGCGAAPRVRS